MKCADLSFGLNSQALAVATLLANREPDFADFDGELKSYDAIIETYPWYNGREKGVAIVMRRGWGSPRRFVLVMAECRNSDDIVVEEWEQDDPYNGPTLKGRIGALGADADQAVYAGRKYIPYGRIGKAADYIYGRMSVWYAREKAKSAPPPLKALPGGKGEA